MGDGGLETIRDPLCWARDGSRDPKTMCGLCQTGASRGPSLGLSFLLDEMSLLDERLPQDRSFQTQSSHSLCHCPVRGGFLQMLEDVSMWECVCAGGRYGMGEVVTVSTLKIIICREISFQPPFLTNWLVLKLQESPELSNSFIQCILDTLF